MGDQNGTAQTNPELVTVTIDGKEVSVPKGSNLIEAARVAGVEVPHYCYHPHLSVPGNCRMCQVEVEGAPKLMIGCHTQVRPDMVVRTQESSEAVKNAQAATLEFILINHPLDCTVCDQSGHCKLQDYHFEYNARPSRFVEDKVKKVKAEPLGPTVILDGERCIMCTRCIRFCDEVTETGELGMLNRGDRSVISINPGRELDNPFSGTVVDLCPVGALTHRKWRFNTRIWYTDQKETICPGCSTGCNVKVAARDGKVVHVKARLNSEVNKEWLCDAGRYGFQKLHPERRLTQTLQRGEAVDQKAALASAVKLKGDGTLIFVAPDLMLEEYLLLKALIDKYLKNARVALGFMDRSLTELEAKLISPDFAPNFQGAVFAGLVLGDNLAGQYRDKLQKLREGAFTDLLIIGDNAIAAGDIDEGVLGALEKADLSVGVLSDASSALLSKLTFTFPGRSVLEKSGLMINRGERLQYLERILDPSGGSQAEWQVLNSFAAERGSALTKAVDDRSFTRETLSQDERFAGLTIKRVKGQGVCLRSYRPGSESSDESSSTPTGVSA